MFTISNIFLKWRWKLCLAKCKLHYQPVFTCCLLTISMSVFLHLKLESMQYNEPYERNTFLLYFIKTIEFYQKRLTFLFKYRVWETVFSLLSCCLFIFAKMTSPIVIKSNILNLCVSSMHIQFKHTPWFYRK